MIDDMMNLRTLVGRPQTPILLRYEMIDALPPSV